jgi:hypothetical protein
MPVVGSLLQSVERERQSLQQRLYYFMAYMNLAIVFSNILILALWRWGRLIEGG